MNENGNTSAGVSMLGRTQDETALRAAIRHYARGQEGYDARLYDLWERWNGEFFEGRMVPSLIQLTDPRQTHCYGCCTNFSGLASIRSAIKIRRSILDGTLRDLKGGTRNKRGLKRFLEDVLLHEMIHQWHLEVTGQGDESYSGHGPPSARRQTRSVPVSTCPRLAGPARSGITPRRDSSRLPSGSTTCGRATILQTNARDH